ncbi:MAG TPA: copper oxidase [Thermoanaerobaculia bacterium]|nr:copper oxidase [Thermoanaerobaculia bacterium]
MPAPRPPLRTLLLVTFLAAATLLPAAAEAQSCQRRLQARVVALDQVFFWNRLGAVQPQGMIFALEHDVVSIHGGTTLAAGNVRLREDKRPRPLVLRMNVGDCINIHFRNLLAPSRVDQHQPAVRKASIHAVGMELVDDISDDGSYVGKNASSLVDPGGSAEYTFYAAREGQHLFYSAGTTTGGEGDGGQLNTGLFGAIVVEPAGSRWYRSQVTAADLALASTGVSSATGHPVIDYGARYPSGHPKAGRPILAMLDNNAIVHGDLTAVITYGEPGSSSSGPPGWFPSNHFPANLYTHPQRHQPFRELVIIYHDEIGAVQAFPEFEEEASGFAHALHSGRDAFAINYGTGGIGAEILANRFGVGPMHDCEDCKYEEFFLTSWAVGDPAMVVDEPANTDCMITTSDPNGIRASDQPFETKVNFLRTGGFSQNCPLQTGPKATKAFFPDDPSNVYHGYLRDHTRFRVLHGGSKEHHIHHLHAHQWLYSGDSDESTYLDSQAFGPGAGFTMEIAYEGGGNKNLTPGDSIFHCHFYPHFAQGMWALWRVHDVFEAGTQLDENGRPAAESRALPDGEIAAGTPIPAVIPLPGKPMAPLPAKVWIANGQVQIEPVANLKARRDAFLAGNIFQQKWNPGFPFFIPGVAGKRPPHPPMDTIHDGGLPRHLIVDSTNIDEAHTRLDFHKHLLNAQPRWLPENGTEYERLAMDFHAVRNHPTCRPDGACGTAFVANGRPPVAGAPYADPCVEHDGSVPPEMQTLLYKAADIQLDVVLNKDGWHFDQQRITALWDDVAAFENRTKAPEPLFFRANSREHCIEYWLANLVPYEYEQDAFQVRTPTDILGQHIHLVKFDVLASDGAANGFNYEDGTFAPEEVIERIEAIRAWNGCPSLSASTASPLRGLHAPESLTAATSPYQPVPPPIPLCPTAEPHPHFGVLGAQTTVQRWYPDPVYDNQKNDRTLRTVFTHDHFGPSTHQQAGLYAGLVVEPEGSTWLHNETGSYLGPNPLVPASNPPKADGRGDGGPTSWQAVIVAANSDPDAEENTFREFLLEFQDFALAFEEGTPTDAIAINPPAKKNAGLQDLIEVSPTCGENGPQRPCPELISADDVGSMTVNYRNEPLALRVRDPSTNGQATGDAGDLSLAFSSHVDRADNDFDVQPTVYPPLTADLLPRDPYTPLLRAYENDRVQIRILVGAHEEGHNFSIHGIKWLFEPSWENSGYRGSQMMGISEHFEFIVPHLVKAPSGYAVDRLWAAGSSTDDYWNGIWGLFRAYTGTRQDLEPLPTNPSGRAYLEAGTVGQFDFSCPKEAPVRPFDVTAITAQQALPNGELVYNGRTDDFPPLFDPTAILYVRTSDLVSGASGLELDPAVPVEPLILRAAAGECIHLTLRNELPAQLLQLDGWTSLPMIVRDFNANDLRPSSRVGLSPQMLYYDVSRYDGHDIGSNSQGLGANRQTVAPGGSKTYKWYAGDVVVNADGTATAKPIEFGATNLISSDPIEHASKGAIGALIIEPKGATWSELMTSRAVAIVTNPQPTSGQDAEFREFVLVFQNDVDLRARYPFASSGTATDATYGNPVPNLDANSVTDAEDTGGKALNYRSEPLWKRVSYDPSALGFEDTGDLPDWWDVVSNTKVGGDPVTPVFRARPGQAIRFRLLQPGGHSRNEVFALHGHAWDQQPYVSNSTRIGRNPLSFWEGARMGHGPTNHFDAVIRHGAGGTFGVEGDYLYRDFSSMGFEYGLWGLLRVGPRLDEAPCGEEICTGDFYCCGECYGCYPLEEGCPIVGCDFEGSTAGPEVFPWLD